MNTKKMKLVSLMVLALVLAFAAPTAAGTKSVFNGVWSWDDDALGVYWETGAAAHVRDATIFLTLHPVVGSPTDARVYGAYTLVGGWNISYSDEFAFRGPGKWWMTGDVDDDQQPEWQGWYHVKPFYGRWESHAVLDGVNENAGLKMVFDDEMTETDWLVTGSVTKP